MKRSELVAADLEKPHWGNYEACIRFLDDTTLLDTPRRVLEIGTGKGGLMKHLLDDDHAVFGVDYDRYVVTEGRKLYGNLPIVIGDGNNLPFPDNHFDIVMSFDVFEHIPDSDEHLGEIRRVLKNNGYYLIQTPNRWTNMLFEPIRFSRKYGIRNTFSFLKYPHHCSLHNYWQLRRRFEKNGFQVKYYDIPVVNEFFKRKMERFLGKPGLFALRVFNPDKLPVPLRTNFFLEAQKA